MFEYTKNELGHKANEMNFVRDTLEKVLRLTEILNYLNSNPLTKENLVLKGGTAINLTVFKRIAPPSKGTQKSVYIPLGW